MSDEYSGLEYSDIVLAHYGKKGMKWGVRHKPQPSFRDRYNEVRNQKLESMTTKAKNGDTISVSEAPTGRISAAIAAARKEKGLDYVKNNKSFNLTVNGKHVGDASFVRKGDELNLQWLSVSKDKRGLGYGSAAFKAAVDYGKKAGVKYITLEVPGESPDARHIYEKNGFKAVGSLGEEDDMWGGLTKMRLDVNKKPHVSHAGDSDDELEQALLDTFAWIQPYVDPIAHGETEMSDSYSGLEYSDAVLAHYGKKGMKWGVHNAVEAAKGHRQASRDANATLSWKVESKQKKDARARIKADPAYAAKVQKIQDRQINQRKALTAGAMVATGAIVFDHTLNNSRGSVWLARSAIKTAKSVQWKRYRNAAEKAMKSEAAHQFTKGMKKVVKNGTTVFV